MGGESLIDHPSLPLWDDDTRVHNGKTLTYHQRFMIPNVFCKVFATWFSQCNLRSICYKILPTHFATYLLHDSPNAFCKVFCYMVLPMDFAKCLLHDSPQWILQSVCYMILPKYFAKCLLHDSPNVLYFVMYLLHDSPNVFCKVFVTWFSQCIFAKYLLHDSQCNLQLFATWLANT